MSIEPAIRAFVERQRVARLATVDAAGRPHLVPIVFALDGDLIWSAVDEKPKRTTRLQRLRNIAAQPAVTLLCDVYDEDWSRLAWVQLRGTAVVLDPTAGDPNHARGVAALRARYPQYARMRLEARPLIRIVIERAIAWGALG